jgi:serpin B
MINRRFSPALALFVFLLAEVACHSTTSPSGPHAPGGVAQLSRPLSGAELSVRDAANAFSFALWGKLNAAQRDTNVFVSPLSASFALGMTMNGADSVTYEQMHAALQFGTASLGEVNGGYRSLIALLQSLDPGVTMKIANSIWYRSGFPVLPSFIDTTKADFGAAVQGLNFNDVPASLATINGWVSSATNGKITSVLGSIDPNAMMFLINAIYFKGSWRSKFDPALTTASTFTSSTGAAQPVQLMRRSGGFQYGETATYQAVDLAYGDSAFAMTVLLPKSGSDIETLAGSLSPATWQSVVDGMRYAEAVDLSLPKLTLTCERKLNADLMALGMVEPFDSNGANFARMAAAPVGKSLYIQFVKQNSFLDINEEGTEAAAVTTVGVGTTSAPVPHIMRVDHPYIVVIRERLTGTVLFMGKIVRIP